MFMRLYLIPADAKVETKKSIFEFVKGATSIKFDNLKELLDNLKNLEKDSKYDQNKDSFFYHMVNSGEEIKICLTKQLGENDVPSISIESNPPVPNTDNRSIIYEIVNHLVTKQYLKIYSLEDEKILNLKELKEKFQEPDESINALKKLKDANMKNEE